MPATKKKKKAVRARVSTSTDKKVTKMSEQMNAMLVVFALAMMMLAYVLVKNYAM